MDDYLTVEEADNRLKKVVPFMEKARMIKRELELIAANCNYDQALLEEQRPHITKAAARLSEQLEQLEDLGCYVKDLDIGLVDFLSTFEGRDIFLCWKLGEPHVSHWHEINEGFCSRQGILDITRLDSELDSNRTWFFKRRKVSR